VVAPGQPYQTVATKRTYDVVPVTFDWHDFLLNPRPQGQAVAIDYVWRPTRALATGIQYRCTQEGVTSPLDTNSILWPRDDGAVTDDGTAQWTSEEISNASLRALIGSYTYTGTVQPPGVGTVTTTDAGSDDLIYSAYVGGGTSGENYLISHEIVLVDVVTAVATGEKKEAIGYLPVQD
jgi:hypothetical protein